jgi:hypothetical protein
MSGFFSRLRSAFLPSGERASVEEYEVRGFKVYVANTRPDIATADVVRRLDESLALIEATQPWRLRHLRHDLSHFIVMRYACRGAFFPDERACMTELTFLARTDITPAPVASSILHEGMHARVHAMGLHPASRDSAREERICRKVELAFGQALPPELGAPVVERAAASLELEDEEVAPAVDWAEAQRRIAAVDAQQRGRQ